MKQWTTFICAVALGGCGSPATTSPDLTFETWHAVMAKLPPQEVGCYRATFPLMDWEPTECTEAPEEPMTVGGHTDYEGQVSVATSPINFAEGTFRNSTVTAVEDSASGPGAYSIQLNTTPFTSPRCAEEGGGAQCKGWEQFLYINNPATHTSLVEIEYWMLNFGHACPSSFPHGQSGTTDCWKNSAGMKVPAQPITNLSQITIAAQAQPNGQDVVIISYPPASSSDPGEVRALVADSTLGLADNWMGAELNVLGFHASSKATFNPEAKIDVSLSLLSSEGPSSAVTCKKGSTTGETNNLCLVKNSCAPNGGELPGIAFSESFLGCCTGYWTCDGHETDAVFECPALPTAPASTSHYQLQRESGSDFSNVSTYIPPSGPLGSNPGAPVYLHNFGYTPTSSETTYRVCLESAGEPPVCGPPIELASTTSCQCVPTTCAAAWACNTTIDDGCGHTLVCGPTCANGDACNEHHSCCPAGDEREGTQCVCAPPLRGCREGTGWDSNLCVCAVPE
jgi:hypothetical protein